MASSLAKLAQRNAVEIRDTHFDRDVALLLDDLAKHSVLRRLVRPFARHGKWLATALLLIRAIAAVYLSQTSVTRRSPADLEVPNRLLQGGRSQVPAYGRVLSEARWNVGPLHRTLPTFGRTAPTAPSWPEVRLDLPPHDHVNIVR